jgi:DNA-binding transcriptional ArsR family regulator
VERGLPERGGGGCGRKADHLLFDEHRTRLLDACQTLSPTKSFPPPSSAPRDLSTVDVITVMHALSDPVRLQIVRQLAACTTGGELSCGQIEVPVTKSTASHHLKTLAAAGLTAEREEGTRKFVHLRRAELERRFPGLITSVLSAADAA